MLCPQNMSVGPRLPESMVWHVLRRQNMLLLLMMMDDDEGCWMMVMVMLMAVAMVKAMVMVMMVMVMVMVMMVMVMVIVMIVHIVFSSIYGGRELRRFCLRPRGKLHGGQMGGILCSLWRDQLRRPRTSSADHAADVAPACGSAAPPVVQKRQPRALRYQLESADRYT